MNDGDCRMRMLVSGHVQGVGFRYAAVAEAQARGVRGWVRNRLDGRVELVAEGDEDAVDGLVAWCRVGPRWARVLDVAVSREPPRGEPPGFRVGR